MSREPRPESLVAAFKPRFIGQLGVADVISLMTAGCGALAGIFAFENPELAARLILLAAIMDALDGIAARRFGGSPAGELFDSLSDAVAFGVAPALFVLGVAQQSLGVPFGAGTVLGSLALAAAVVYVLLAVVRLALYTAHDADYRATRGMPTTLAATFLTTGYVAGLFDGVWLLYALPVCAYLMSTRVTYPDLLVQDAFAVGVLQFGAVIAPVPHRRWFAVGVFAFAVCYATLSPRFYAGRQVEHEESPGTVMSDASK